MREENTTGSSGSRPTTVRSSDGSPADGAAFKPPDVKLFTPSGRFEVGHKICMSMTS